VRVFPKILDEFRSGNHYKTDAGVMPDHERGGSCTHVDFADLIHVLGALPGRLSDVETGGNRTGRSRVSSLATTGQVSGDQRFGRLTPRSSVRDANQNRIVSHGTQQRFVQTSAKLNKLAFGCGGTYNPSRSFVELVCDEYRKLPRC
jgi:hypothetical protein